MTTNTVLPTEAMNAILLATALDNKTKEAEVNPFEGVNPEVEVVFEPLIQWFAHGNSHERSKTIYKKVEILYDVVYSWNILKRPTDTFSLGLILPIDTVLPNGGRMIEYYCPDGFGCPDFNTLKDALSFIDDNLEIVNNQYL